MHASDIGVFWNLPVAQTMHRTAPAALNMPAGQTEHSAAVDPSAGSCRPAEQGGQKVPPSSLCAVPAVQSTQAVAFVAAWNWPDGQAVQLLLAEEGWNLPAEQTVHVLAPRPLNVPGPQLVHAAWLSDAVNWPGMHGRHSSAPVDG